MSVVKYVFLMLKLIRSIHGMSEGALTVALRYWSQFELLGVGFVFFYFFSIWVVKHNTFLLNLLALGLLESDATHHGGFVVTCALARG